MGLIRKIKAFWKTMNMKKQLKKSVAESIEKDAQSLTMSANELSALSDDDLFFAVLARTEKKVDGYKEWAESIASLNYSQKVFYSLNWMESEVNNGGLCQFFVNSSRMVAPYVSEYMKIVGAEEHKKLYDDFVNNYGIDLMNLSFFDIEDVNEFSEKNEAYPFDEYDNAFYNIEPLETYLKRYIRDHLEDF